MALTCPDETSLRSIADRLTAAGVCHSAIVETEGPYAGQLMAIGALGRKEDLRRHLSSLPCSK